MGKRIDNLETQICKLQQQNKRLQDELDREIKNNRKLVKALKKYADKGNWDDCLSWNGWDEDSELIERAQFSMRGFEIAEDVLKEVEEV